MAGEFGSHGDDAGTGSISMYWQSVAECGRGMQTVTVSREAYLFKHESEDRQSLGILSNTAVLGRIRMLGL